ncbi:hypothetical protein HMPREF3038_01134 [Akkermansia sp. KLE1797]|nr:hypothetical protein HMPREF3038_01134 [Akkermansia sp. KLE1797]KXU53349.1 hypothetical protein HMPREF3039_02531 [Akkermansia sp. KLE1798]
MSATPETLPTAFQTSGCHISFRIRSPGCKNGNVPFSNRHKKAASQKGRRHFNILACLD